MGKFSCIESEADQPDVYHLWLCYNQTNHLEWYLDR